MFSFHQPHFPVAAPGNASDVLPVPFGIYVHIPYCLQLCTYCDFTKYELGSILSPTIYTDLLLREIDLHGPLVGPRPLSSLYFGGGTPSLMPVESIVAVINRLSSLGFKITDQTEVTFELNPGTPSEEDLDRLLDLGINRFSVGVQSFNERLLRIGGRKHTVQDTIQTLTALRRRGAGFTLDLLFAMPTQTLDELGADIDSALEFAPDHISTYYLTVPESHPLQRGRAPDEEQAAMFHLLESRLEGAGLRHYEISNYARPGRESRHNLLYWSDQEYWGIGVSAHSYFPKLGHWGTRLWNGMSIKKYETQTRALRGESFAEDLPAPQIENLKANEALTDFCHISLRQTRGLDFGALCLKFGSQVERLVGDRARGLLEREILVPTDRGVAFSREGRLLTNLAFADLTFLAGELPEGL
jgi:oxygen-independent coproporphyrinogen-3 oxidase